MNPGPRHLHRKRCVASAFTLVELLAVITIIGLLASIFAVVISRARERARATQSVSNMRQIALGMLVFTSDNKLRQFPNSSNQVTGVTMNATWDVALLPYMGADTSALGYSRVQGLTGDNLAG